MSEKPGARELVDVAGTKSKVMRDALGAYLGQPLAVLCARFNYRGILSAVLQDQQSVVQQLVDGATGNDSNDSAHGAFPQPYLICCASAGGSQPLTPSATNSSNGHSAASRQTGCFGNAVVPATRARTITTAIPRAKPNSAPKTRSSTLSPALFTS